IYSFRGANIDNILKFTKLYNNARLFKLEQNYRSTQLIVKAANSLIAKNREQIKKEVFSENQVGEPLAVYCAYSDVEEGEIVANKIAQLRLRGHYGYDDFAVLYRTNAQSRIFEEALRKRALPYRIYGGLSFYQRKEIKDVIAYFRLAVNPHDEEAFKRIINYPARGIGDTTLGKIIAAATQGHASLWEVLCDPLAYGLALNKGTHAKLQGFRSIMESFIGAVQTETAYELGGRIVRESGIMNDIYQDRSPENLSRQENIEELINGMHDFCMMRREEGNERILLGDFLSEVSLMSDQDTDQEADAAKITLMTIHSAKGLEFKNVFVVGMEENLFPSQLSGNSYKELEEERRLFYVAITRAEEHCFLTYAKTRFKYGKTEFCNPSRFLKDIDARYLDLPQEERMVKRIEEGASRFRQEQREEGAYVERPVFIKTPPRNLKPVRTAGTVPAAGSKAPAAEGGLQVGDKIAHERFGQGEVLKIEETGENCKATVRFQHAGEKQLLLKFARFKKIE
ncbi:MAG: 3'-5' exonuclease, partial [Phocaeicola sp.]|nr:3'-5' exonuclease [Phocaeicola sp.]